MSITTATAGAWMATATHPLSYPLKCTIYYGEMTAPFAGQGEGAAVCQ
jgi:hypothetical protein